ncbi:unnamed protein product [Sphagnum compactum]
MAAITSCIASSSRSLVGPLLANPCRVSHRLTCSCLALRKFLSSGATQQTVGRSLGAVRSFSGRPFIISGVYIAGNHEIRERATSRCMASQVTTSPDLIDEIIHDHREFEEFYSNYKKAHQAGDEKEAEKWFNQLVWELSRHTVGEELVVYPLLDALGPKGKEMADKDRADHTKIKKELEEIYRLSEPDLFESALDRMMDELRQHIKKEETQDLEYLKQHADKKSLESAAKAFMYGKKIAPTRPHPSMTSRSAALEAALALFVTPLDKLKDMFTPFPKEEHTPYQPAGGKQDDQHEKPKEEEHAKKH